MKIKYLNQEKICNQYIAKESPYKIAKENSCSAHLIYKILAKNNIKIRNPSEARQEYEINNNIFESINCEWKAYFLGFLLADGNVHRNVISITLNSKDREVLDIFNNIIFNNKKPLYITKPSESVRKNGKIVQEGEKVSFQINNKKICEDLLKWGLTPRKSSNVKFPENFPEHLLNHFIRGYFDGDGWIMEKQTTNEFGVISSESFIVSLKEVLEKRLNIKCYIYIEKEMRRLKAFRKEYILKLNEYLYKDSTIFLNRKRNKFKEIVSKINGSLLLRGETLKSP